MKIKDVKEIKVLYDSILVKFVKPKETKKEEKYETSEGGIIVPKSNDSMGVGSPQENALIFGEVVSVGHGYVNTKDQSQTVDLQVKEGNWVIIDTRNNANNTIFKSEDKNIEYRLVREQNILTVCDDEKALKESFEIEENKGE